MRPHLIQRSLSPLSYTVGGWERKKGIRTLLRGQSGICCEESESSKPAQHFTFPTILIRGRRQLQTP